MRANIIGVCSLLVLVCFVCLPALVLACLWSDVSPVLAAKIILTDITIGATFWALATVLDPS